MILGFEHTVQLSVFFKSIGMGYIMGLLYAAVMFFNAAGTKKIISVFLRDVLFFIVCTLFSFLFVLKFNAGITRFYTVVGEIMGFCIFYIFPGRPVIDVIGNFVLKCKAEIGSKADKIKKKHAEKSEKRKIKKKEKEKRSHKPKITSVKRKKSVKIFKNT